MSIVFDHQSNSLRIDHTYDEFMKGHFQGQMPAYNSADGTVANHISYRHEHAHFTSFLATGLSELQSITQNFRFSLLISTFVELLRKSPDELVVPLIKPGSRSDLSLEYIAGLSEAWDQSFSIESSLLGYGINQSVSETFRFGVADRMGELVQNPLLQFNLPRYRRFLKQILFSTPPQHVTKPGALSVRVELRDGKNMSLSPRSVLEAFAITIEVIAEYIKCIRTSANVLRTEPKRVPPRMYTVALEEILEAIVPERNIGVDDYIYGKAGSDVYWAVALTSFAAMQVPVIEDVQGDAVVMGSLKQLNPAMRLVYILNGIQSGSVPNPLDTYRNRDTNEIFQWIVKSHESVNDYWSIKFNQHIHDLVMSNFDHFRSNNSMHKMSWLARAMTYANPVEMIGDGGAWLGLAPRYVRTSDNKFVIYGNDKDDEVKRDAFAGYVDANAIYILQAMTFGDSWDTCWDKVAGLDTDGKLSAMTLALGFYMTKCGCDLDQLPEITLADGYT
ncbi:MAG: hypothetical protein U0796_19055 [Gemmatales bacterium]